MSEPLTAATEVEQERQRQAEALASDNGPNWMENYRPGTFGCHELLDRAAQFSAWLENDLLNHPACVANPEWYALAEQAAESVRRLYQRVGAEHV